MSTMTTASTFASTTTIPPTGGAPRLARYLGGLAGQPVNAGTAAYLAALDHLAACAPLVAEGIEQELRDQRRSLKLIASENFSSLAVQLAMGNLFTDKYSEGYPQHRFYAGCDNVDVIETEAARLACELFGAEHAYVQPHSGADANLVAFAAILSARVQEPLLAQLGEPNPTRVAREDWNRIRQAVHNQRLLALDYYSGGHLTHGYRFNMSGRLFDAHTYRVDPVTKLVDLDRLREQLHEVKPLILLAGYSAYSRKLDFARMREMADEVGAVFMVDMAHFAGLVAGKVFTGNFDPVPHAHVVTSTTHKTLRGPRGGIVLCKKELAEWMDRGCPSVLGGPLPHVMAAKAVAFQEALTPAFRGYAHRIVDNARALAEALVAQGVPVLTGGTDNHLLLADVAGSFGLTGRQAESALRDCGVTLNRNSLPDDANGPWYTSGLRFGTPATTTLGMGAAEMKEIAAVVKEVLAKTRPARDAKGEPSKARYETEAGTAEAARARVAGLLGRFPLYPELGEV
jgi:glycine hydroxymethyltransferase